MFPQAGAQRCSVKKEFLKISQNSQTCNFITKETLAQVFSSEFCEISKNTISNWPFTVAASVYPLRQAWHLSIGKTCKFLLVYLAGD